jgi:hypothetical protein
MNSSAGAAAPGVGREGESLGSALIPGMAEQMAEHITGLIESAGGWLPFDRYMAAVLYTPGLGYYARGDR